MYTNIDKYLSKCIFMSSLFFSAYSVAGDPNCDGPFISVHKRWCGNSPDKLFCGWFFGE